ncbi:MAG TPA: stalk domain-containing protein, partial [Bacillota bacterium]
MQLHRDGDRRLWWRLMASSALAAMLLVSPARAVEPPEIVLDGRVLAVSPAPRIESGRTLIPLRAVFEAMGASVQWDGAARSITVARGDRWVRLWVGQRTACLVPDCSRTAVLDVPAQIHGDRAFVPLRFVGEALGAGVSWDGATRRVVITSGAGAPPPPPVATVGIAGIAAEQRITGPVALRLEAPSAWPQATEVRYYLLDPQSGRGPVVARQSDLNAAATWLPDPALDGRRLLTAALYDADGRLLASGSVPVVQAVVPGVALQGVSPGQRVDGAVSLRPHVTFVATHVRYELIDPSSGRVTVLAEAADPYGEFRWAPAWEHNGPRQLRVVAYDRLGRAYASAPTNIQVQVERRLALTGVSPGAELVRPVTLGISANFAVQSVTYRLHDPRSGAVTDLAERQGTGTFRWFPGPERSGEYRLDAKVVTSDGVTLTTDPVTVRLPGQPRLYVSTVGPGQVLAGDVELKAEANVPLREIAFELIDPRTGAATRVAGGSDANATYTWRPQAAMAGERRLRAVAIGSDGTRLTSEELPVRVHAGPVYGSQPIIAKDRFLGFAAELAAPSRARTGMSAALQVAQAILETGWGQYVPVDKYSGRLSNNLFGIKGQGPAGSVISNTWEEYNGVAYRIDAAFRAYRSPAESWADHKQLLLTAARYEPFRAVMHDPIRGAWALRRAGYATDSAYPRKLID